MYRSFFKKVTRKRLIILAIFTLLLSIIAWALYPKNNQETVQVATVKQSNLASVVSASGKLRGKDSANLKFKISGKLAFINVKKGDQVNKGEVIAGLDIQELNIALQQAYNNLRLKEAVVEKVLDEVKDHSDDESFSQKQTRTLAEVDRDNAYDTVKAAERAFQDAVLTAPISGIITDVQVVAGQVVTLTDNIAQVSSVDELYFDADVDEADIGKIVVGKRANVELDAYPDRTFKGQVSQVMSQTETSSSGATTVKVRINLGNPDLVFVSGLSGQAEITISEAKNVLTVPIEALREDNSVVVKTDKGYKAVKVKTGIESETDLEIKNGLKEGDRVILNPSVLKGV